MLRSDRIVLTMQAYGVGRPPEAVPAPAALELRHWPPPGTDAAARGRLAARPVEAEDDGLYVLKFRGAGQGSKALAAELIAGELARALGLPVPDLVLLELDPAIGRAEPDAEIQDRWPPAPGPTWAWLPARRVGYSPVADAGGDRALAADIVWFDGLVTNVDRSPRNPNLLMWHGRLWLIDHGAALYVQHSWMIRTPTAAARSRRSPSTCCCRPPARSARPTSGWRRGSRPSCCARCWPPCPPTGWAASPPRPTSATCCAGSSRRGRSSRRPSVPGSLPPEARPFQYVIVRVVPRVDRGEQLNAGVVLYSAPLEYLAARMQLDEARLAALAPSADPAAIRPHLDAICAIAAGDPAGGRSRSSTAAAASTGWPRRPAR